MSRVVITGASGFIGLRLVRRLLADGFAGAPAQIVAIVRNADRLPSDVGRQCTVAPLDLASAPIDDIRTACGAGATVVHLAASASASGGETAAANNERATERLVEALREANPRRIVYVSSIGAVDREPSDPCTAPLSEDAQPNPLTRYGRSKLHGERVVAASGLPFAVVRPTWVYGPGMREDSHLRVLLSMVRRRAIGARIRYPGRVSVIHVSDLCDALVRVAVADGAAGRTFFASDGSPVALGDLLAMMGETLAVPAATLAVPRPARWLARRVRPALPFALQNLCSDVLTASNDRIASLGFRATVPLRRGIIELARDGAAPQGAWIVTGAASGIGRALAEQLHARGADVIAVDRSASGLAALQTDCPGTEPVVVDLATSDGCARVAALVAERARGPLAGVVNCAGIGARGPVGDLTMSAERDIIAVNVSALAAVTAAAVSRFSTGGGGVLVNVASSAAFQPLPFMAAYAASKAFVLSYSEAVASEVTRNAGICVITVCPGGTDTGFQSASGVRRVDGERLMSPYAVAAAILAAADRGRSTTMFIGRRTWAMAWLARLLPRRSLVALWGRLMRQMR